MTMFLMATKPRYPNLTTAHHCSRRRDAIRDSAEAQPASKGVPEPPGFRVVQSIRIDESLAHEPRVSLPLALGDVGTAMTSHRVPYIDIWGATLKSPPMTAMYSE